MKHSLILAMLTGSVIAAEPTLLEVVHTSAPSTPELRGFGRVATDRTLLRGPVGEATLNSFRCQDAAHARTVAGKYLADLDLSPGTSTVRIASGSVAAPVRVVVGGAHVLVAVAGATVQIVTAANQATLDAVLITHPEFATRAVDQAEYPTYLDRFDRYGFGFYGFAGYGQVGTIAYNFKNLGKDIKASDIDPLDDLAYCAKNGWRFEPWLDPSNFDDSDGIIKNTEAEWQVTKAKEAGLNLSFRLYGDAGGADWTGRRFADLLDQPFDFLTSGWHGRTDTWKSDPHLSWSSLEVQKYLAVKAMGMMRTQVDQPNIMGWMHPHGELVHSEWYNQHADRSALAQRDWRAWLGKRCSLAEVNALYNRSKNPFSSWEEVMVPEFATFAGLDGRFADLAGTWWARREPTVDPKTPLNALPQPGIDAKWWEADADQAWTALVAPGSDALQPLLKHATGRDATWFKRSFNVSAADLARAGTSYLYWFPMSSRGIHVGEHPRFNQIWINGQPAGEVGSWGALDVSKLLHAGENRIAVRLLGDTWDGRMFLSSEAPSVYPYLAGDKNRLWLLWDDWRKDIKHRGWDVILDGMRQVDPNRPIKFMAPIGFGDTRYLDLAERWGGFGHFTGEGMWFFPWYKRGSFLYGLPGTSEMAGPANNLPEMFDTFRRIFLAGLNGHDAVFLAQHYTRMPELRKFIDDHASVLHQMGRYDLAGSQVLIHRSTRATTGIVPAAPYPALGEKTRAIQSPWDWDLGRGSLQTLGHSYLYLDDSAVTEGRMTGYSTMVDCGNEILDPKALAKIGEWVDAGGTYIAFACTGRNSLEKPDAWQVEQLAGCELGSVRTPGKGTVTIAKGSTLFPGLGGKTYADLGRCTDFQGGNHCLWDVALKPGAGAEVAATYEDGTAAVVRVRKGSGQIIVLGSSFWRGAADVKGIWWPQVQESEILGSLLTGVGQQPQVTSTDRLVWAQPYRSNNGLDAVACLVSWNDDKEVTTTVRMRLPQRPTAAHVFEVGGERELPVQWADGVATIELTMPAKEVKVVRFQGAYAPDAALAHWWDYQQRLWHALAKPSIDFTPYTQGRWADPTIDLRQDVRWTANAPTTDAWKRAGFDATAWKATAALGLLTLTDGAPQHQPLWIRKSFTLPPDWQAQGGTVRLVSGSWFHGDNYLGSTRLALNGTVLHEAPGKSYQDFDVTALLTAGENIVTMENAGDREQTGMIAQIYLYHRAPALGALDLAGVWTGTGKDGVPSELRLPGTGEINRPTQRVLIPAEWAGQRVQLVAESDAGSVFGVWINGRQVRRHHHALHGHTDIDITEYVRFGEMNELILARPGDQNGEPMNTSRVERVRIDAIHLERFANPH
jgi:hypothetical protein